MTGHSVNRTLPPLTALRSFESAARHMSFTGASAELHVTPAAISQQIRALEQFLQCKLFHRDPRGLRLTQQAEAYLPLVHQNLNQLATGTVNLFGHRSDRPLTIRTTSSLALGWLSGKLAAFRDAFPDISVRFTTFQWQHDGIEGYVDLEFRYGAGDWPGLEAEPLIKDKVFAVCAPEYIKGDADLCGSGNLTKARLLHVFSNLDGWSEWLAASGVKGGEVDWSLQFDSSLMAYQAAVDGMGVALGRRLVVDEFLKSGKLVEPFEYRMPARETFYLVRPQARRARSDVDSICRWLKEAARSSD